MRTSQKQTRSKVASRQRQRKVTQVKTIGLGEFEVELGEVVVSDPCHKDVKPQKGFSFQGILKKVKKGTWTAEVIKVGKGSQREKATGLSLEWGTRCAELRIFHESHVGGNDCAWEPQNFGVGVDSGQAGIFDRKHYRDDSIVPSNYQWRDWSLDSEEPWYSLCCDKTISDPEAGVIPYGAVSRSGFGDGLYHCFVCRDENGQITAIKIVFIPEEEQQ